MRAPSPERRKLSTYASRERHRGGNHTIRAGEHLDSIGPMSHHWRVGALQSTVSVWRGGGRAWAVSERAALGPTALTRAVLTRAALTRTAPTPGGSGWRGIA